MANYKVSVIISIYNAQDTIKECIDSVISQTLGFSNIELILYDWDSTDNTLKILKDYSDKYENIILISDTEKSNYALKDDYIIKGRKKGIKIASADYIMFLDGNDKYAHDICEILYNEITEEDADIVFSNILKFDKRLSKVQYNEFEGGVFKNDKIYFIDDEVRKFTVNCSMPIIFKKSIIVKKFDFSDDALFMDSLFIFFLSEHVNKIIYLKNYAGYLKRVPEMSYMIKKDFRTDYKISVIVSLHNAQDTIRRCIDSVINQTIGFSNIELILYDDKSTDNTRKILKDYSDKYYNIILILSNENSGYLGKGRNEGIRIASADYIMFLNSNDEYSHDMCEKLYDEIIFENSDIVSSNILNIDEISSKIIHNQFLKETISKNDKKIFLNEDIYNFQNVFVPVNIYKKSTIVSNLVNFLEDNISDAYFNYLLLFYIDKIVYLNEYIGYIRHMQEDYLSVKSNYSDVKGILHTIFGISSFYKEKNLTNIDLSYILSVGFIFCFRIISQSKMNNMLKDNLLVSIWTTEIVANFNDYYLDDIYKIPNRLIMNWNKMPYGFLMRIPYKLAIVYLNILGIIFRIKPLRKIYRNINNN